MYFILFCSIKLNMFIKSINFMFCNFTWTDSRGHNNYSSINCLIALSFCSSDYHSHSLIDFKNSTQRVSNACHAYHYSLLQVCKNSWIHVASLSMASTMLATLFFVLDEQKSILISNKLSHSISMTDGSY